MKPNDRLKTIVLAIGALWVLCTPVGLASEVEAFPASKTLQKTSPLLLKKLRATVPGTDQIALMNLYNDSSVVVQVLPSESKLPVSDLNLSPLGEKGLIRFYSEKGEVLAELNVDETENAEWSGEGEVKNLSVRTLSNRTIRFDGLKMENSQFGSDQTVNGVLKASESRLNVVWHVVLGRGEHAGVSLLFDSYDQSHGPDNRYFILKKTPFGLTELNYKFNSRQLFIDRRLGDTTSYTVLLEYSPETQDEKIKKDVAKLKVQKRGSRIDLKLQSYPESENDQAPAAYREIELVYDESKKSFSLAEDRSFQMNSNGEYGIANHRKLDLGEESSLSDVMADIVNNRNKVLGDEGISVPAELIDFISLLDPVYQEGLLRDAFLKHISEFLINDAEDPLQPELLAASIDTVLFDRGMAQVLGFLVETSPEFSKLVELYDKTAKVRFEKDRLFLKKPHHSREIPQTPPPAKVEVPITETPEKAPALVDLKKSEQVEVPVTMSVEKSHEIEAPVAVSVVQPEFSKIEVPASEIPSPQLESKTISPDSIKTELSSSPKEKDLKSLEKIEKSERMEIIVKTQEESAEQLVPQLELPPKKLQKIESQSKLEIQPKLEPLQEESQAQPEAIKTTGSAKIQKADFSFEPEGISDEHRVDRVNIKETGFEAFRVVPLSE